jgi:hypothetical protein
MTSGANAFSWRYRGHTPTFEEFCNSFQVGVLVDFVAFDSNIPVGCCLMYNYDGHTRHACIAAIVSPNLIGTAIRPESVAALCWHAFRTWDLRKIYAEVPSFILFGVAPDGEIDSAPLYKFSIEGQLTNHYSIAGEYVDIFIVATERLAWNQRPPADE